MQASRYLSYCLFKTGYDVKNEIHGMSQRERSVSSFLRYGEKVHSPVVFPGEPLLSDRLREIRSPQEFKPSQGERVCPGQRFRNKAHNRNYGDLKFRRILPGILRTKNLQIVNALEAVKSLGNAKLVNTLILGVLSNVLSDIKQSVWKAAIGAFVKKGYEEKNYEAFEIGRCIRL